MSILLIPKTILAIINYNFDHSISNNKQLKDTTAIQIAIVETHYDDNDDDNDDDNNDDKMQY